MNTLAAKRQACGWSQAELARRAQMHSTTVSLIESGRLVPGASQIEKLAKALGCDAEELKDVADSARR